MPPERPPNPNPPEEDDRAVAEMLLNAYAQGLFPMAEPGGEIYLFDPDPRGVIPLDRPVNGGGLRVPRSLRQRVRSGRFAITTDRAFSDVIRACATPRPGEPDGSWIDGRIIAMYEALHRLGFAHSVEAWLMPDPRGAPGSSPVGRASRLPDPPTLVGGLYGVHLRGLFAGESMFSRPDLGGTDASKVCLVHLWRHLRARGFTLLDTQFTTPHLERLGVVEISREAYHSQLKQAMDRATSWEPFALGLTENWG